MVREGDGNGNGNGNLIALLVIVDIHGRTGKIIRWWDIKIKIKAHVEIVINCIL